MYQEQGQYKLAETYAAQSLAGRRHASLPNQRSTIGSGEVLAEAYLSEGKFVDSEPLARDAFDFNKSKQPDDLDRFYSQSLLGGSLAGQNKYAEAEPLLIEGYQGMLARKDEIPLPYLGQLDRARERIVQLYQAWGKPAKAAEWGKK
jgi:eukaryotic-like serine/threonine-protein kinase